MVVVVCETWLGSAWTEHTIASDARRKVPGSSGGHFAHKLGESGRGWGPRFVARKMTSRLKRTQASQRDKSLTKPPRRFDPSRQGTSGWDASPKPTSDGPFRKSSSGQNAELPCRMLPSLLRGIFLGKIGRPKSRARPRIGCRGDLAQLSAPLCPSKNNPHTGERLPFPRSDAPSSDSSRKKRPHQALINELARFPAPHNPLYSLVSHTKLSCQSRLRLMVPAGLQRERGWN